MAAAEPSPINPSPSAATERRRCACNCSRSRIAILLIVSAALLAISFFLAPWVNVRPVPVEIRLVAPQGTQLSISWNDNPADILPMVRFSSDVGKTSNVFLAELPPRPEYHLAVRFDTPVDSVLLRSVTLINLNDGSPPFFQHTFADSSDWITPTNVQSVRVNNGFSLTSPIGGEIGLGPVVIPRPSTIPAALFIWLGLIIACGIAYALLVPLFSRRASPEITAPTPTIFKHSWPLWLAFIIATSLHLILLDHSPVVLAGGDTNMYMLKAVALATRGTTDLTGWEWELNRLPGYPLFIAIGFKTVGYNLTHLAMMQGLFFCCGIMALALSLRKWIQPWIAAATIMLAILSPAQVWTSRTMLSESVFGSWSLFALATFFMHLQKRGKAKATWLILFACLSTCSFFARPNGITLAAALVPLCIPAIVAMLRAAAPLRDRMISTARYAASYAAIFLIPAVAIGGWSYRNYLYRGFFGPTDMTGITELCGLIASGTFDIQCLADSPLYAQYLDQKHKQGQYFPGFNLRHDVYQLQTHGDAYHTASTLTTLDDSLRAMVKRSKRESPWQVNAIGYLRSAWWAVAWPDVAAYSEEGIRLDYVSFDNISGVRKGTPSLTLADLRANFLPHISPKMVYEDVPPNAIFDAYSIFANWYYNGWYVTWSILAMLSAIYLAWRGNAVLAAPIYVFVANVLLNVVLLNVFSRYIHVLDGLLFFECALALSLWMRKRSAAKSIA